MTGQKERSIEELYRDDPEVPMLSSSDEKLGQVGADFSVELDLQRCARPSAPQFHIRMTCRPD